MFGKLFGKKDTLPASADRLLSQIVAQSRRAEFYRDGGVPDTLEGRFEMMVVAAFPVFYRLKGQGERADRLAQLLFDRMFREIDISLREMGVGDLKVPRKIKAMAQGFYGRVVAYERALGVDDRAALEDAVARNVFSTLETTPEPKCVTYITDVLESGFESVKAMKIEDIMSGKLPYGSAAGTKQQAA